MKIISGSSNNSLSQRVAKNLGLKLLDTTISRFSDGELKVQVNDNIGDEVAIIQSTSSPVNDHLMELLLLADTAKRAGSKRIVAIVPYFGYSRQDRCTYKYGPISASLVIRMLEASGITEVITFDLHSQQLEGAFNIPVTNLSTESIFFPVLEHMKNIIIVSPDIGGIPRARNYSALMGVDLAIINKSRDQNNQCTMNGIIGEVRGKNCIIVDDIIDGASTICLATELLLASGAVSATAIVTHGVLSGSAVEKINNSKLSHLYISDTIDNKSKLKSSKITALPVHELIRLK